jgi:hypothetical protein
MYARHRNKLHTLFRIHIKLLICVKCQAAAVNRTPTPTVEVSEAQESTDSDDDDYRLSWQAVSGRDKERSGPRTRKAPTMKKKKPPETSEHKQV